MGARHSTEEAPTSGNGGAAAPRQRSLSHPHQTTNAGTAQDSSDSDSSTGGPGTSLRATLAALHASTSNGGTATSRARHSSLRVDVMPGGSSANGSSRASGHHHRHRARHGNSTTARLSMPIYMLGDMECPVCRKIVPSDDAEVHLVMCLTRPKLEYNVEVVAESRGEECAICLEDLAAGETLARLPCLCVYHRQCIDAWFKRKNCCPEHPGDD